MTNKRSRRRKKLRSFFCLFYETRLCHLGSPKYYLFVKKAVESQNKCKILVKNAIFLANQNPRYTDSQTWLEKLLCSDCGNIWRYLSYGNQEELNYRIAKRENWLQTSKSFKLTNLNLSVS